MDARCECTCSLVSSTDCEFTPSTFIYLAWAIVVGKYSDSKRITIASSVIHQLAEGTETNGSDEPSPGTFPIDVHLASEDLVHKALRAVQEQTTQAFSSQHVRGISSPAQHAFRFQSLVGGQHTESSSLELHCTPASRRVDLVAEFNRGEIGERTVGKILRQVDFVVQQAIGASPSQTTIGDIDILTPEDREELWSWNAEVPAAVRHCIHDVIWKHVAERPAAAAVCAWDGELTYSDLDVLATRFAGRLAARGLKHGSIVPLCFEKSMWATVAALAVLKAGATFVLLDPQQPMLRLKAIVEQTGAQFVVASEAQKDVSGHLTNHTVSIVEEVSQISYMAALQSLTPVDPSTAAYLVFTSGSTGCPKGILIEHASFCSAMHHQLHHFDVRQDSRVFDFASYSFDISLHNMLATLSAGACLCVPSDSDRVGNTTGVMASMRATVVSLTTSVARLVEPAQVPTLQTLILAGEAVFSKDVSKWWGRVRVINAYGPAECTPISIINSTATDASTAARIGTGKGSVTWVVDPEDHNRLLPPGVVGELLLEGPCLARCYLENAKKTSEAFIQDVPWLHAGTSTQPGRRGRLYKTGDLVCYHEDGSLTYMGRKDTQIKIHGQRVEIGEVEHHIRQLLPDNLDLQVAVDLATPQNRNAATLVVFASFGGLTKREHTGDDAQSRRVASALIQVAEQLREILPSHMVPTSYKLLDELPLTATAKIDRRALRALGNTISGEHLTSLHMEPECKRLEISTKAEEHLRTLWSNVLGIEPSAINADKTFYQLGGNSVQAIRLVGAAREVGMTLEVADVYKHPRLTDLAKRLKASDGGWSGHAANRLCGNGVVDQSMEAMLQELRQLICQIPPSAHREENMPQRPKSILLTGSTGTVGTYLLHSLLARPSVSHVYCLNRRADGFARHEKTAKAAGFDLTAYAHKVTFLRGTLDQPRFGIKDEHVWGTIQADLDVVLHVAWPVNYNLALSEFRSPLQGLINLFEFAAGHPAGTEIIYISSISAVGHKLFEDSPVPEDLLTIREDFFGSGYGKSKYVAEHLCEEGACQLGLPITCVRMGQVAGPIEKPGLWNPTEWFPSLMLSSMYMSSLPDSLGTNANSLQWIPVDVVSEFVVELVEKELNHVPGHASILNLLNSQPASWTSMLPAVAQSMQNVLDTPVEVVPARVWLGRIEQALQRAISNRDTSIVSLIDALPAVKLLDSFRSTFSETRAQKWEVKKVLATECMRVLPAVQSSWLNEWIVEWGKYRRRASEATLVTCHRLNVGRRSPELSKALPDVIHRPESITH